MKIEVCQITSRSMFRNGLSMKAFVDQPTFISFNIPWKLSWEIPPEMLKFKKRLLTYMLLKYSGPEEKQVFSYSLLPKSCISMNTTIYTESCF